MIGGDMTGRFRVRRAAALGALLMGTTALAGMIAPVPALAQTTATATRHFNIPAQSLREALLIFGQQSGLQVTAQGPLVEGRTSSPVSGDLPLAEALSRLLTGTGLTFRFDGRDAVRLEPVPQTADGAIQLGPVRVEGESGASGYSAPSTSVLGTLPEAYAGGQVARGGQLGMLGNRDVMDTPFSQTIYTSKTLQNQQARTVQEVLNNDPSVVATNTPGLDRDFQAIRGWGGDGFDGTRTVNGMVGMAAMYYPSADYLERVEILKGPSALLNGASLAGGGASGGPLGGSVNLVTKRATDEPITRLTTRFVSDSQIGGHLDVGRRFGAGNEFGIRFNGSIDGGHTPIDTQTTKLGTAALNLDYSGEHVRISADFAHQTQKTDPLNTALFSRGVANSLSSYPRAPSSTVSLVPSGLEWKANSTMGMIRGEIDIFENVTAYAAIGKQKTETGMEGTVGIDLVNDTGRYTIRPGIRRASYDALSMQGGFRATVNTGSVKHALSMNISRSEMDYKWVNVFSNSLDAGTIYNPVFPIIPITADPGDPKTMSKNAVSSIGFTDILSMLDDRIQFTAGIRYQEVKSKNFNTTTGLITSEYNDHAWTPAFGLVVKPWGRVSLYANYIEDLKAGSTVGTSYANAGEIFPPYVNKQYEAGVKVDWGQVMTTLAVFEISRNTSMAVADPAGGLPTLTQNGQTRHRGIEFEVNGEVTSGFRLMGGLTLIDPVLTNTAGGTLDGKRGDTAPKVRAVIGADWDMPFLDGLTLNGRLTHTGDVVITPASGVTIPSWTTADLGARYTFISSWNEKPVTLRFNVDNVFDKDYWAGSYSSGQEYRGAPRTFRLSATFDF
ncbi:MAG: TonB-dependent receptor [Sphingobium sp.]